MKIAVLGAAIAGVFLLFAGMTTGTVVDKRAPGDLGDKTLQLRVDGLLATRWVTVDEQDWDGCDLRMRYPACTD